MKKKPLSPTALVYDGTATSGHTNAVQQAWHDAEKRRDENDKARKQHVPVDGDSKEEVGKKIYNALSSHEGQKGIEYSHMFRTEEEQHVPAGHAKLRYLNRAGEVVYHRGQPLECLARVISPTAPKFPGELAVIFYCPKCLITGKLTVDQCMLTLRQSNRRWHLDMRTQGEPFAFMHLTPSGQRPVMYRSAGIIIGDESFTCARCSWKGIIDNNAVRTL